MTEIADMTPDSAAVAAIGRDVVVELRHKAIGAAWTAWHSRHGGKLGPGPAFTEAIDAALAVFDPAFIARIESLEAENARLREALGKFLWGDPTIADLLWGDMPDDKRMTFTIALGDYRAVRSALARTTQEATNSRDGERQGDEG